MNFCPLCFKMLLIESTPDKNRLLCKTCRYYFPLHTEQVTTVTFDEEEKVEVLEQGQQSKLMGAINVRCPKCDHDKAYYDQRQTRSADEAATLFFTCVACAHKWNQN